MDNNEKALEFHNKILQAEFSIPNYWWYEEFKEYLTSTKEWALKNKNLLKKEFKYDVEDIYKQVDEFEYLIRHIVTITNTREEAVILSLIQYALQKRPLIISSFNAYSIKRDSEERKYMSALNSKVTALIGLVAFYLRNHKNIECYNALKQIFVPYIQEEIQLNYYSDYGVEICEKLLPNNVRYEGEYVINYLKILITHKDFEIANKIFDEYPVKPINKKQTADYDRIKLKLGRGE